MSGRAYRRLLKQRESDQLAQHSLADASDSDSIPCDEHETEGDAESARPVSQLPVANAFSFLMEDDAEQESADENEHQSFHEPALISGESVKNDHASKHHSKKKSAAKKGRKSKVIGEEVLDDPKFIETVKQELEIKYAQNKVTGNMREIEEKEAAILLWRRLFEVQAPKLDPEYELRRKFGTSALSQLAQENLRRTLRKFVLTVPKNNWPRFESMGLSMQIVDEQEGTASTVRGTAYAFKHGSRFENAHMRFLQAVAIGDSSYFTQLHAVHPYHPDNLILLSRIVESGGDHEQALELVSRALFTYESAALASFSWTGLSRNVNECVPMRRLPYKYIENRGLHLAMFRRIIFLERQSCWSTAFEWTKMLYSLDADSDPLGCLFLLDFYSLRSQEYDWYIDFICTIPREFVQAIPHVAFGLAFALFLKANVDLSKNTKDCSDFEWIKENAPEAVEALLNAVVAFPNIGEAIRYRKKETTGRLSLIERLFLLRIDLTAYFEPASAYWVDIVLNSAEARQAYAKNQTPQDTVHAINSRIPTSVRESMYRHIIAAEHNGLMPHVPSYVRTSTMLHDPLPPKDGAPSVYDALTNSNQVRLADGINPGANPLFALLHSILPWVGGVNEEVAVVPINEEQRRAVIDLIMSNLRNAEQGGELEEHGDDEDSENMLNQNQGE